MVTMEDMTKLQQALDKLCQWADMLGMAFNTKKCKVMHMGRNNPNHQFSMGGLMLDNTEEERDMVLL